MDRVHSRLPGLTDPLIAGLRFLAPQLAFLAFIALLNASAEVLLRGSTPAACTAVISLTTPLSDVLGPWRVECATPIGGIRIPCLWHDRLYTQDAAEQ